MGLKEFLSELESRGVSITEPNLRWAYRSKKLERPRIDASNRFDFTDADLGRAVAHFTTIARRREIANA